MSNHLRTDNFNDPLVWSFRPQNAETPSPPPFMQRRTTAHTPTAFVTQWTPYMSSVCVLPSGVSQIRLFSSRLLEMLKMHVCG
jgi:hypothetical protein